MLKGRLDAAAAGLEASMAPTYLDNPDFWRARAEEARAQAEQMRDHDAKRALLGIADVYERLAKGAEEYMKRTKPSA